jgi:hypothetical protein
MPKNENKTLRDALEDMVWQFAYRGNDANSKFSLLRSGRFLYTGGLWRLSMPSLHSAGTIGNTISQAIGHGSTVANPTE